MDVLEQRREEVEQMYASLDSLRLYCVELRGKGSPADIARAQPALHAQAHQLLNGEKRDEIDPRKKLKLRFTPAKFVSEGDAKNLIGEINLGGKWIV